ncbi:MAG: endonuclease VIII [Wenzhouxiangella sp.]
MPEGPEMYRVAQRVERAIARQPLAEVWFALPQLQQQAGRLQNQQVERVHTLGKALIIRFNGGDAIYTHNQLYGRWLFSASDRRPDSRRQLRLALSTAQRSALLYSASDIELIEPGSLAQHPFMRRAGLDILSSAATPDAIADWIVQKQFARRRLGLLLLDQSFLAGVGNYLRSEILFLAQVHPAERPVDLGRERLERLAKAAHTMMWRSVKTAGITNDCERVAQLKAAGWKRRDYRHFVFSRVDQACFVCGTAILRETVASRRLYRCPGCQPAAASQS